MPRICSFYGITIWFFWEDHNPPHFHAKYNEYEILIRIVDLSIYSGYLPSRLLGFVVEWASLHQKELFENWEFMKKGLPLKNIEPLK